MSANPITIDEYSSFTNGSTVRTTTSIQSQSGLVATSTRSPALKTGPCPARIWSTTRKLRNASSSTQRCVQPSTTRTDDGNEEQQPGWESCGPAVAPVAGASRVRACVGRGRGRRRGGRRGAGGRHRPEPIPARSPTGSAPGIERYSTRRSTLRSSCALSATTMVERLMSTAPTSGPKVIPAHASAPAASGIASTL